MESSPGVFASSLRTRSLFPVLAVAAAAVLGLVPDPAAAQWTADPTISVKVCGENQSQRDPRGAHDGEGGVIIAWSDERTGPSFADVYAQRLDSGGNPIWTAGGVVVDSSTSIQHYVHVAEDGAQGAYIMWHDLGAAPDRVRMARLNSSGNHVWGSPIDLGTSGFDATLVNYRTPLIPDGVGGAIAVMGNLDGKVYVQRVYPDGSLPWGAAGVVATSSAVAQSIPTIATDGAGGAVVAWGDVRNGNADIFAQRVDSTGTVLWTANGVDVCIATGTQGRPIITSDGAGGAIILWTDARGGVCDLYAQRLDASGAPQWTLNGVLVAGMGGFCTSQEPTLAYDALGGAVMAWVNGDVFAQRVDASGNLLWNAGSPVTVCNAAGTQLSAEIVSGGPGAAMIAWQDFRNFAGYNVYAQLVDASGVPQWLANGDSVEVDVGGSTAVDLILIEPGTAVVAFADDQGGVALLDIEAERIPRVAPVDVSSPLTANLSLTATPNPSRHYTDLRFDLPATARGTVQIYDVAGRKIRTLFAGDLPAGPSSLRWDGREDSGAAAPGGIYFIRLRAEGSERTVGFVKLGQ